MATHRCIIERVDVARQDDTATPFGVILSGFLSQGTLTWVHRCLCTLESFYVDQDASQIDFAIPSFQDRDQPVQPFYAMTYSEALYHLRHYMTLPWVVSTPAILDASNYTIHGLKATLLSWASQANLPESDRRLHGKHKPAQMSVQLFSRDDIEGSLRVQIALTTKIVQGWRPTTPLGRGGQAPLLEPHFIMEGFRKDLPQIQWKFFKFQTGSQLQLFADIGPQAEQTQVHEDEHHATFIIFFMM